MSLYYRDIEAGSGRASFADEADHRRNDPHRGRRRFILNELAPRQERELNRLLFTLARLDESDMKKEAKRHLLALLRKVPLEEDPALGQAIRSWIAAGDPAALYDRLRTAIGS